MESHLKAVAILFIILGIVGVIGALIVFALFIGGGVLGAMRGQGEHGVLIGVIGTAITVIILITSIPGIVAGWGLLRRSSWARILGIVLAILNLPSIPFGTALGVYALWVLFHAETVTLFERKHVPASQPPPGSRT